MKLISVPLILLLIYSNTYAAKIYRHVPFEVEVQSDDVVIVNYNFSEKTGIHCSSTYKTAKITFLYKGREKIAALPVILLIDHIPEKNIEQLADVKGQFSLSLAHKNNSPKKYQYYISCTYLGESSQH